MTRADPRARLVTALLAVLVPVLLAGCVAMPEAGPVVETSSSAQVDDGRATSIDPLPPQEGASMVQVAQGFLEAMTATPIQTSVAAQYLAADAQTSWDPAQSTVIYDDTSSPVLTPDGVRVRLTSAERLDERGAWEGEVGARGSSLDLRMVLEDGEHRIANPPNALVVPASWFEQRFREVSLFFFDRTGRILVPESVFVPRGEQLASTLVSGLLAGPAGDLDRVTRTFIPDGLSLALSVPISADGVAQIELTGDTQPRSPAANSLMLAQFAWTLRQDPSIEALRMTIAGEEVALPGDVDEFRVDAGAEHSPTGYQSSTLLYGLDGDGRMVSGTADDLTPVEGPLGVQDYGIRSLAVDLEGQEAVGVSGDGTALLRAPVRDLGESPGVEEVLSGATDLLTPGWDFAGRVWLVDRTPTGARVIYLDRGRRFEVDVPGITGENVRDVLVSRDATRLVAVVRGPDTDRLVTARVLVTDQGTVRRAVAGTTIGAEDGGELRVRDLVWSSTTSVSLLSRVRDDLSEVRTVTVDGAPSGLSSLSTTITGTLRFLVGTPVAEQPTFGVSPGGLVDVGVGVLTEIEGPLRTLAYAG